MEATPAAERSAGSLINLTYFAAFIALGMAGASLGPTLDALADQTGASLERISWLFPFRSFGYLVGAVAAGRLFDRRRGHPLMAAALFFAGAGLAAVPSLRTLALLVLVLWAVGFGEGLLDVGTNTLIVWLHGRRVGPYMNGLHFCFGLGSLLAPLIVAWSLSEQGGIAAAYWVFALAGIPVAAALLRLRSPVNGSAGTETGETVGRRPGRLMSFLLAAFFFFYVGAEIGYGGWIYLFAVRSAGAAPQIAAYVTSAFWGAFTLGRLAAIPLSTRLRPRRILVIDFAGALLSLGLILVRPDSLAYVAAGSAGLGLFIAPVFPTMITYAGNRFAVTARLTSLFFLGATLGGMTLPWLVGQFFEGFGPLALIVGAFASLGLSGLALGLIEYNM